MATKHTDSCLIKAGDDEPIFVLRAQDALAPGLVREWALQAQRLGTPHEKLQEAHMLAEKMVEWQRTHLSKVPD
jgi:hypothetical protein